MSASLTADRPQTLAERFRQCAASALRYGDPQSAWIYTSEAEEVERRARAAGRLKLAQQYRALAARALRYGDPQSARIYQREAEEEEAEARRYVRGEPSRYVRAQDVNDWKQVHPGLWYSPSAKESRTQLSRPGSRGQAAQSPAAERAPPAPVGPMPAKPELHFRRSEEGFAAALGGVWNGEEYRQHPADITVFGRDHRPLYHVELKDRSESERDTASIDPNAAIRKMEMIRLARDELGRLVPFITLLPMWRSNRAGALAGIVVRFKPTFSPGEYREAVIPGLNTVDDLKKPTIQQRLRRLIETEVARVDRAAYEKALAEESRAAERYFLERLERSRKLVEAFSQPPKKRGKS